MLVTKAKVQDELFLETKIEPEDFELSLRTYIKTDPDIKEYMQCYMQSMQSKMDHNGGGFMQ